MIVYPAIDLRGGRCVRLHQGDYAQETVYGDDPVAQALAFADAGATWVHVVDLDAARSGAPTNRAAITAIITHGHQLRPLDPKPPPRKRANTRTDPAGRPNERASTSRQPCTPCSDA